MRDSNMAVSVAFLVGTSIEDACTEAKEYAIRNNLALVRFDFNGVKCSISKRADIEVAVEKWKKTMESKADRKFFVE